MVVSSRRLSAALIASAMLLSMAAGPVLAQATVGPAGGVGSTTAPSNSQGTPAGGTGTLSTTRVGPTGTVTQVPSPNTAPAASPSTSTAPTHARRVRHRARVRHPAATQTGTQSQAGTNGAEPTTK